MTKCKALTKTSICGKLLTKKEIKNGGFCSECWTTTIVDDYSIYEEAKLSGYTRKEAAELAGIVYKDYTTEKTISNIKEMRRKKVYGGGDHAGRMLRDAFSNADVNWKAP